MKKLLLFVALVAGSCHAVCEPVQRFEQDVFCIGSFIDPPIDENAVARYREMKEANFNVVMALIGSRTPETLKRQVALSRRFGMKTIVGNAGLPDEQLPDARHVWGYFLRDEPSAKDFPALAERVAALRVARPGKLAYINLFPSYCDLERLGTPSYDEHVRRFVAEVNPDVLCMDHYPIMRPDKDGRPGYLADLDTMRRHALAADIPWWNYFNTMPYGPHMDPTEAQLRWQAFASVAYGARGVLYFCYWTPTGDEFPKGGAILTAEGRKTRHYEQAKRINAKLGAWGPTLMQLTSAQAGMIQGGKAAAVLAETPLVSLSEGEFVYGVLRHADGRRALVMLNHSTGYTAWPTVQFDGPEAAVTEVDPETGRAVPLLDDSPAMPGLQLSFDAGDARLFLLPPAPQKP